MYRVRWARRALDELASLWAQGDANLRRAITSASHTIDQRLRKDPYNEGESRSHGERITFVPPLSVRFRIESDGHAISILQVRLIRQRST